MVRRGPSWRRRKKRLRDWELQNGPDSSELVWELPDGWTIRRLVYIRDALREGHLMNHCLSGKDWPEEAKEPSNFVGHKAGWDLLSLRDPENHPRVTFHLDHEGQIQDPHSLGYGRGLTDPAYLDRLEQFVRDALGRPFVWLIHG